MDKTGKYRINFKKTLYLFSVDRQTERM